MSSSLCAGQSRSRGSVRLARPNATTLAFFPELGNPFFTFLCSLPSQSSTATAMFTVRCDTLRLVPLPTSPVEIHSVSYAFPKLPIMTELTQVITAFCLCSEADQGTLTILNFFSHRLTRRPCREKDEI